VTRADTLPGQRPLRACTRAQLQSLYKVALDGADGLAGAHCIHEAWMRGDLFMNIDAALETLWSRAAASIPDWLPMTYFERLPSLYDAAARFTAARGRANIYLVLLDYRDSRSDPFGIYVGMSSRTPQLRFDQHKAGIRAAGSVLKRGLELLTGPVQHLQHIARAEAALIEERLAETLRADGWLVHGGH
jgi:hypothetical protein